MEKEKALDLVRSIQLHYVSEDKVFKNYFKVSESNLKTYYKNACNTLQKKEYDLASDAFLFLVTLNPNCFNYWLNLGVAEQLKGDFQEALKAFTNAALIELDNPTPYLHSSECYISIGNLTHATNALKAALDCPSQTVKASTVKSYLIDLTKMIKECKGRRER